MRNMDFLRTRVKILASTGLSPYQIEEQLNITHYTIHINFHSALMDGYEKAERKAQAELHKIRMKHKREMEKLNKADDMSEEKARLLRNALERDFYNLNKEEIKRRRKSKNLEERIRNKSRRSDES